MTDDRAAPSPQRKRTPGLGRGLSALLGEIEREEPLAPSDGATSAGVRLLPVSDMRAHPGQPRQHFDETALDELAESIRTRGMLQPIVVRRHDDHWQIVAGERRWRAAQRAQVHQVPVIVKELDDAATLEIALIENIQREQLNAIEEGETYRRLIRHYGHSQEALAAIVHKSRSHIANLMRLLELPTSVRGWLAEGKLTMGHARALANVPEAESLAVHVIESDLSVRQTEMLARRAKSGSAAPRVNGPTSIDPDIAALETQLGELLGLKVKIANRGSQGAVTLAYSTLEQLDMLCQRLSGDRI